ncbi:TPA: hypothetical protein ACNV1F_004788 [Escherichia coli]|nr:hypothetical protein [Escherichia coli]
MNKNIRILQFLVSILYSVQSHFSGAQTIQLNGNGIPESITRSITGVDGNAALNISVYYLLKAVLTSKEEQAIHQSVVQVSTVKTLR